MAEAGPHSPTGGILAARRGQAAINASSAFLLPTPSVPWPALARPRSSPQWGGASGAAWDQRSSAVAWIRSRSLAAPAGQMLSLFWRRCGKNHALALALRCTWLCSRSIAEQARRRDAVPRRRAADAQEAAGSARRGRQGYARVRPRLVGAVWRAVACHERSRAT